METDSDSCDISVNIHMNTKHIHEHTFLQWSLNYGYQRYVLQLWNPFSHHYSEWHTHTQLFLLWPGFSSTPAQKTRGLCQEAGFAHDKGSTLIKKKVQSSLWEAALSFIGVPVKVSAQGQMRCWAVRPHPSVSLHFPLLPVSNAISKPFRSYWSCIILQQRQIETLKRCACLEIWHCRGQSHAMKTHLTRSFNGRDIYNWLDIHLCLNEEETVVQYHVSVFLGCLLHFNFFFLLQFALVHVCDRSHAPLTPPL